MSFWEIVGSVAKTAFEKMQEKTNEYRATQDMMDDKSSDELSRIWKDDRHSTIERTAAYKKLKERDNI